MLPHLALSRGVDFFASVLLETAWLVLLLDPVACVRAACVTGMPVLVQTCGPEWMIQHILPQHVRIYNHAATGSYLVRITIIQAHAATAVACEDSDSLWNDVVLQMLRGIVDEVPNVRMVAALGLAKIVEAAGGGHQAVVDAQIVPALEKRLAEEEDMDCRAACALALEKSSK